jgi:proline iminopeptidase
MTFYDVNGARLAVHETGTDINGTIITVHGGRGAGTHAADLRAFAPLADAGFRVISYDQRGHGESSQTSPLTYQQLADDLEELRRKLVGKPAIILGGSFGGYIALTYAVKYQGSYSHLILRGTAPSWHHETKAIANAREAAKRFPDISPEYWERMFAGQIDSEEEMHRNSRAIAPLADGRLYKSQEGTKDKKSSIRLETARELFRIGHEYDVRDKLDTITAPTLVLAGTDDWTCTIDNSYLLVERIPNAVLLAVGGAPHAVHVDSARLILSTITDFVAAYPARTTRN